MSVRALVMCGILLTMLGGCDKARESYDKQFKESFHNSFVMSCTASAVKKGMREGDAAGKCECVAGFLINKYSVDELKKLTNTVHAENKAFFAEAMNSCK